MNHRGHSSKLAVEIRGNRVTLEIECVDRYEAMMLYDKATEMAREGYFKLEFATRENEHLVEGDRS